MGNSKIENCLVFLFDVVCRRHHLSRRRVIPLPKMKANPVTHPQALFQTDQVKYTIDGPCIKYSVQRELYKQPFWIPCCWTHPVFNDVGAHCYCATLLCTQINSPRHASSAR